MLSKWLYIFSSQSLIFFILLRFYIEDTITTSIEIVEQENTEMHDVWFCENFKSTFFSCFLRNNTINPTLRWYWVNEEISEVCPGKPVSTSFEPFVHLKVDRPGVDRIHRAPCIHAPCTMQNTPWGKHLACGMSFDRFSDTDSRRNLIQRDFP